MQAQAGSKVRVVYMGRLSDGSVFDTNQMGDLLEFTVGQGALLPGFENTLIGMQIGEKRVVTLPPEQAYGQRDEDLVGQVQRGQLATDAKLERGGTIAMDTGSGNAVVKVVSVDGGTVTLDANHPLAGKELTFEIELVEILP